jgi:hypothetical protein
LHRPDPDAPVSSLYLFGRKQDLAFEEDVGGSADRRHHVRWWRAEPLDAAGRPLWIGDATFDRDAGISHLTGQITHHIGPASMPSATGSWPTSMRRGNWPAATNGPASAPRRMDAMLDSTATKPTA